MVIWWKGLNIFEQFYYIIGFASLILMILIAILIIFGVDPLSGRVSIFSTGRESRGIRFVSVHTFAAFLLGFGWGGIICLRIGLHEIIALLLSCVLGILFMFLMYLLMLSISGLNSRDPAHLHVAVGAIGEVYSTIPANRSGYGKVRVQIGEDMLTLIGETNSASAFKPGEKVRIIDQVSGSRFLVRER